MIRGIGTSKGIGIGHAVIFNEDPYEVVKKTIQEDDIQAEKKRFVQAKDTFIEHTNQMIADLQKKLKEKDKTSLVLHNQIYLIQDEQLQQKVEQCIEKEHICVEAAFDEACNQLIALFRSMNNEAMNQRIADIIDLREHMFLIFEGRENVNLTQLKPGTILIAKDLRPSITATMDTEHVVGIVAENGGETSHAAILARALEIPAVLNAKGIVQSAKNGDTVIIDGDYGEVFVRPIPRTVAIYEKKQVRFLEKQKELRQYINKQTLTQDGKTVCLAANIGNEKEAAKAMAAGAEGVGLFRTEFLFMNGVKMPDEEEQFMAYRAAAVLCKDTFLTIRTLDIGGDKDIPYMGLSKENNPFLGYRAIRFCLDRLDVFTVQLRAILRASAYGRIRIMIPMITSVVELRQVRQILEKIKRELDSKEIAYDKEIQLGIMVETPAAAIMSEALAAEADFFSIGTNDLTQYIMAVDRGNENVAYLYSTFNPAVLKAIRNIIANAKKANIEVGMCGEAASNPAMIPLLLAYGLDEFSVSPAKILETRKNIAGWNRQQVEKIAQEVDKMATEKEIVSYLNDILS